MASEQREREDKYDADADFATPDLSAVVPPGGSDETASFHLSSTYYDTATGDLLRNRLTLRRREGDTDTGWHLKVAAGKARTEVRLPDQPGPVPEELSDVLAGVRRGQDLVPVARLTTVRSVHRLSDGAGQLLAEVADDEVSAVDLRSGDPSRGGAATVHQWREVEVEAGPAGGEDLLAAVGELLIGAGARPSESASKLERTLGPPPRRPPIDDDSTLADLVSAYIGEQCAAIVAGDVGLRLGHDVIHPTRVAIRRLRSTLRTFALLFDRTAAAHLDHELVWLAGLLGGVRDADVLRERLRGLVDRLPPELVMGPVAARIDEQLAGERADHSRTLDAALRTPRLLALLDAVELWRVGPPFAPGPAGEPGPGEVPAAKVARYLRKSRRKLRRRLKQAGRADATGSAHADELMHRARKAGKRYRYAAELAAPALGADAVAKAKKAEALQDLLGEHQDSVVSADVLRRLGAVAGTAPGENGFTFGVLLDEETRRGAEIRAQISSQHA